VGDFRHTTVLLDEVVSALQPRDGGLYLDLTTGGGGHTQALLDACGPTGRVVGLDRDTDALAAAGERLAAYGDRFLPLHSAFGDARASLDAAGFGLLDGLVADLGVSSYQLDTADRGFSFRLDGPLDLRMDRSSGQPASEWLDEVDEATLFQVLTEFGEERHARLIARRILSDRPFTTTTALAGLVERVMPGKRSRIHPATRTFQALRIAVNDELGQLDRLLDSLLGLLAPGARAAIISFHSLEDRRVKRRFRQLAGEDSPRDAYGHRTEAPLARMIGRKAVKASDIETNPRARSARMRTLERLPL
jgi:16S rRNA (cytosine1402-N4)-methyltransferase